MSWMLFRHGRLAMFFVLMVLSIGCGGNDGPRRYERRGKVTFNGQPVEKGEFIISPDRSKGASGPGATVTFEEGYRTRKGMGTLSGPHVVTLSGYDNKPGEENAMREPHPRGTTLFTKHRVEIDFPAEASTHDFDITE